MKTELLNSLYSKYDIANLTFGTIHDKLGDLYEEYCQTILESHAYLLEVQKGKADSLETQILSAILSCNKLENFEAIEQISATRDIPKRTSGGNSKTDIIAKVCFSDGSTVTLPISCKQSTVARVAIAEFDVETICREMKITNPRFKQLLLKHQLDCSAKNFTAVEKEELISFLAPIRREFVRWALTGSPTTNLLDECLPTSILKFQLKKPASRFCINIPNGDFDFVSFEMLTVEESIDKIMYKSNGEVKSGGFYTGLSWTYATGSKGHKIQFKG